MTAHTISLLPLISLGVVITDTTVIDVDTTRRRGTGPALGVVQIGGAPSFGSVRLTGSASSLRRLAQAALAVADATERAAVTS